MGGKVLEYEAKTILQNGIKTGKVDSILKQLEELGDVSDELRLYIQKEKDVDVLQTYLKKAFTSQSMEEFEQWLQQIRNEK